MKVYLAAGYSSKKEISIIAGRFREAGIEVTSTWTDETYSPTVQMADLTPYDLQNLALRDITEIEESDAIVLFTQDPTVPMVRGGRMHEFGYAQAAGKRLIVVGPRENIFHYLPNVEVYSTWDLALLRLTENNGQCSVVCSSTSQMH